MFIKDLALFLRSHVHCAHGLDGLCVIRGVVGAINLNKILLDYTRAYLVMKNKTMFLRLN